MANECKKYREEMHRALDGELDSEERSGFEAHLAACPACRRDYGALKRAVAAFEAAPRLEPSPTFVADVVRLARLAETRQARSRRKAARVTIAASAAGAAVAAGAWAWLFKPALGTTAVGAFGAVVTAAVDNWKAARALAVPADVIGKLASALGSAGSQLARDAIQAASPVYLGAFVAIALFYLVWRAGSRVAAPLVRAV